MADSKRPSSVRKPSPRIRSERKAAMGLPPEFPLFPHKSGRWAKQVRGKRHYFGKVSDDPKGEAALRLWLDQKDDLFAGRTPRDKSDGLTVAELCDRFLQAKDQQLDAGEITAVTRLDYKKTTDRLVAQFGKNRLVTDLASDDFEALRANIAKTRGPVSLGNEIQRIRVVFKYGFDAGLSQQPMRYGPLFKRPSRKVLRLQRAKKGQRMIESTDVRRMLDTAAPQLKAMILLAVNCGFGNSDCGTLPLTALDLAGGWINYHRPKTGIDRRCPLWPETVQALQAVLESRSEPKGTAAKDCVFVTKYGSSWAGTPIHNPVSKEFRKLLDELKLHRKGVGFYTLRHVFRTIADEARDQPAANGIMGHADESMAAVYRERISDERLRAVADHVRTWLFPPQQTAKPEKSRAKKQAKGLAERTSVEERPASKRRATAQTPVTGDVEPPRLRIVG
jgi:integrase